MDPISVSVVVALLTKYAKHMAGITEDALDGVAKDGLAKLWTRVRTRLAGDPHAASTLDRMAEQPDNELRQAALQDYLADAMHMDHQFAADLARLAQPVTNTMSADVRDSGAVALGGSVSISGGIAAGRDVVRPNVRYGKGNDAR